MQRKKKLKIIQPETVCGENEDRRTINKILLERMEEIKETSNKTKDSLESFKIEIKPFMEKITRHDTELGFYRLFIPIALTTIIGMVVAFFNSGHKGP
jgi:hypothetical protein